LADGEAAAGLVAGLKPEAARIGFGRLPACAGIVGRVVVGGLTRTGLTAGVVAGSLGLASGCGAGGVGGAVGGVPAVGLTVVYRPHGAYPLPGQTDPTFRWTLSCWPPRGTHPARGGAACRELALHGSDLIRPLVRCLVIVRGAPSAAVTGVLRGQLIRFDASTCSPAWRTLHALLTGSA
jgi:hypothetical protein